MQLRHSTEGFLLKTDILAISRRKICSPLKRKEWHSGTRKYCLWNVLGHGPLLIQLLLSKLKFTCNVGYSVLANLIYLSLTSLYL